MCHIPKAVFESEAKTALFFGPAKAAGESQKIVKVRAGGAGFANCPLFPTLHCFYMLAFAKIGSSVLIEMLQNRFFNI